MVQNNNNYYMDDLLTGADCLEELMVTVHFSYFWKIWCKLNRFRTGHGKCNNILFHWNIRENPSCECGAEKETIQHIVEECPLTKFQQGFSKLHLLTEDALNWLQQIKNI
jgi:hypothetical protein